MADFLQGFLGTYQAGVEARNDVTVAVRNWFANRNPLVTRLALRSGRAGRLPDVHPQIPGTVDDALGAAISSNSTDLAHVRRRDVPDEPRRAPARRQRDRQHGVRPDQRRPDELDDCQRRFAARPARRPLSSVANGSTVNLIGNSRNGAEVNQTGLSTIGVSRTQYCQTFQFPVQIGGSAQTARAQVMPGGIQTPFDFNMTVQLQNMVDDIENSCYYGIAQAHRQRRPTTPSPPR